jgi:energy-coupling factor transport system ATP-binding protein
MDLLAHFRETQNMTIIVVTHAMELVAEYCDRTLVMLGGKLLLDGPTREVMTRSELLRQTRVQAPPITRLAMEMAWTPPPLTVEEAMERLGPAIRSGAAG